MIPPQIVIKGLIARLLPGQQVSGPESDKIVRLDPYGGLNVNNLWANDYAQADEGAYMTACMLPAATALQSGIQASFLATQCPFVLFNSAPSTSGINCYLRFLRLAVGTVGTSGTALQYAIVTDNVNRSPTTVSTPANQSGPGTAGANTAYRAPVASSNMNATQQGYGIPFFTQGTAGGTGGPTVPSASPQARTIVGNGFIKGSIPVVNDQYNLQFGSADRGGSFQAAAALCKLVEHAPPVVIGPGQTALIYVWSPGNITAGNAWSDVSMEWVER